MTNEDGRRSRRFFDVRRDKPGEVLGALFAYLVVFVMFGFASGVIGTAYWWGEKRDSKRQWALLGSWLAFAVWIVGAWLILRYHLFGGSGSDD